MFDPTEPDPQDEVHAALPSAGTSATKNPISLQPDFNPPVLARIGRSNLDVPWKLRAHRPFLRSLKKATTNPFIIEQVRQLRDAILASTIRGKTREHGMVVALTSPRGGEGVSLLSLLLGLSLADCVRHRVAVLDGSFDGKRFSVMTQVFGLVRNSINITQGERQVVGFWNRTLLGNLYFLKSSEFEQSLRFFSDRNLDSFFREFRTSFDFTLIGLPPLLKESAGFFPAPYLDDIYLVTEAGKTKLKDVGRCQRLVEEAGGKLSGAIINKQTAPFWSRFIWREAFY
jgi:Mrp family chromosome partitioning ATPase